MKVLHEVLLRASAGKIKWWQAAELIGISPRQLGVVGGSDWSEQGQRGLLTVGAGHRAAPLARAEDQGRRGSEPVSGQVLRI